MDISPVERDAAKLRELLKNQHYLDTVHKWLLEGREKAIRDMCVELDDKSMWRLQGFFNSYDSMLRKMDAVERQGEVLAAKRQAKFQKQMEENE